MDPNLAHADPRHEQCYLSALKRSGLSVATERAHSAPSHSSIKGKEFTQELLPTFIKGKGLVLTRLRVLTAVRESQRRTKESLPPLTISVSCNLDHSTLVMASVWSVMVTRAVLTTLLSSGRLRFFLPSFDAASCSASCSCASSRCLGFQIFSVPSHDALTNFDSGFGG